MTNAIQLPTPGEHVREHYRKQGEARAEARIIKLIDDIAAPYGEGALISVDLLKMLIKGENK
jgi:hypothetical protein